MRLIRTGVLKRTDYQCILYSVDPQSGIYRETFLNHAQAFLWDMIENVVDPESLVNAYYEEYVVSKELARKHVNLFLNLLVDMGILSLV